jgi:hypothetical protein
MGSYMLGLVGIIGTALGLALLPIVSAVAAQFVVIDSTSPNLPAGAIVEGTRLVSIAEGERVTLVPEDGNTRTIRGPFNGALEDKQEARAKNSGMIQTLAKFVALDQGRTIGAVVRGETTAALDEPFLLPIDVGGRFCVRHGSVTLWRPNASEAQTLIVKEFGGQADLMRTPWPAGDDQIAWPAGVALKDGKTYVLGLRGGARARQIHVVLLNGGAPTTAHEIARLADHECFRQARSLLQTLLPRD